jgi:hypothetical protein
MAYLHGSVVLDDQAPKLIAMLGASGATVDVRGEGAAYLGGADVASEGERQGLRVIANDIPVAIPGGAGQFPMATLEGMVAQNGLYGIAEKGTSPVVTYVTAQG